MRSCNVEQKYRIFAWDNGGAAVIFKKFDLKWQCVRDETTDVVTNVGKALAMRFLIDTVTNEMPGADCYVCMDDDIIVDRDHIDALVTAARRPELGMIAPRFHPFNSVVPDGGKVSFMDTCPICKDSGKFVGYTVCLRCGGLGKDPSGLRLHVYPKEDRTLLNTGRVAGGLFAISKASVSKLPWAPHLYPILSNLNQEPVLYWTEDATLDGALTAAGLINGYLDGNELTPVIHLPELNEAYKQWKLQAQKSAQVVPFDGL